MEPKLIWANFVSSDIERTNTFYTALGFKQSEQYTTNDSTSFMFGQTNFIINFFTEERLSNTANGNLSIPKNGSEILFSISAENREEVDNWVDKVKASGGTIFSNPQDYEKGYTFGFADPDGHKFNVLYWPGM